MLGILVPIRRFASLIDELNFNFEVAREGKTVDHLGALFRENEFHRLLSDGALSSLPSDLRTSVTKAYVAISRANHEVTAFFSVPSQHRQPRQERDAFGAVSNCLELIREVRAKLALI